MRRWRGVCLVRTLVNDSVLPKPDAPAANAQLRALVLGYLDDHPTAMDTLDGIAEWWVLRQQIEIEVRRVSHVLNGMVTDGLLEVHEQDGIRFFRRPQWYGARRMEHEQA